MNEEIEESQVKCIYNLKNKNFKSQVYREKTADQAHPARITSLVVTIVGATPKSLKVPPVILVNRDEKECPESKDIRVYQEKIILQKALEDDPEVREMSDPMDSGELLILMDFWQYFIRRFDYFPLFVTVVHGF